MYDLPGMRGLIWMTPSSMTVQESSKHDASIVAKASRELPGVFRRVPIMTTFQLSTHGISVAVYSLYARIIVRTYAIQARIPALNTSRGR
jgi:hypothetical protein